MKIKYWVLVTILTLGVIFVTINNCGNSNKYNKLKGEYQAYYNMSRVVIKKSIEAIDEQNDEIGILSKKITYLHGIIEVKDEDLADKEEELGELKRDFADLEECQAQYDKLVVAFTLCKSINANQDETIFYLTEKYNAQLKISLEWKKMYESERDLRLHGEEVNRACDKALKKIRLFSKAKTGIAVVLAGLILYNMVK